MLGNAQAVEAVVGGCRSLLSALLDLFSGSSVSRNFKLDKNRVQRFSCEVTIFILDIFLEIEQKPALATL